MTKKPTTPAKKTVKKSTPRSKPDVGSDNNLLYRGGNNKRANNVTTDQVPPSRPKKK